METLSESRAYTDLASLIFIETNSINLSALEDRGWLIKYDYQALSSKTMIVSLMSNDQYKAVAIVCPAVGSYFQAKTMLNSGYLQNAVFISSLWISPELDRNEILPCILYLALRRGRIWGKTNVVTLLPDAATSLAPIAKLQVLSNLSVVENEGVTLYPFAQRIKYSLYYLYQKTRGACKEIVDQNIVHEIIETVNKWLLNNVFKSPWVQAIYDGSITKFQYINLLYNTYQYVRLTLRLISRCIAFAEDMELRDHFVYHLRGEVNHELIIERDIKCLGGDLDYMKYAYVADPGIKEFMVVQESTIGFYQDPVLMLACPLVAEGISANIKPEFLEALLNVIKNWNVANPKEAARFFSSHVNTDGGEDGHWTHVIKMIEHFVTDELVLQKFLGVLYGAMNGLERGYNAVVQDLSLWSVKEV